MGGMFLPLLLRDHLTNESSGEALVRFLQTHRVGGVASFHTPPSHTSSNQRNHPPLSFFFFFKAEFTARPFLRQQIPARCCSLRLLSWSFFWPSGSKRLKHLTTALRSSNTSPPPPAQQAEDQQARPHLVSKSSRSFCLFVCVLP